MSFAKRLPSPYLPGVVLLFAGLVVMGFGTFRMDDDDGRRQRRVHYHVDYDYDSRSANDQRLGVNH